MRTSTSLLFSSEYESTWPEIASLGFYALAAALLMTICVTEAQAQNSQFGIVSPTDGATVNSSKGAQISYDFRNNVKAHHIHLLIDDVEIAMSRKAYGEIATGSLTAGKRKICISPVNTNHTPIGDKQCITLIAE